MLNLSNAPLKSSLQFSMEKCMVNGEDILLKQQKQHNFDHFIAVLLEQLVIHSDFNQAMILFRRCYCGLLNLWHELSYKIGSEYYF